MSRPTFWSTLLMILLVVAPIAAPRAESWSEPVYTKPWSEPEPTEPEPQDTEQDVGGITSEEQDGPRSHENEAQSTAAEIGNFLLDFENLYGTWYIWTPGTAVNLHDQNGDYVTHDYVVGADQGQVVVNNDGTYSMSHVAWQKDTVVEGRWRLSFPREINGEVLQAIVLIDGITGVNWAIAPAPNGKMRLLWATEWADGSATWIFDSELFRE